MSTENVQIVIGAEDKATEVIVEAATNAKKAAEESAKAQEMAIKKAANAQKQAFKDTKASSEFFGTVAGIAGGGQLASAASQVAQLTERVGAFNEVAQQGNLAALGLKGGLVAATAVMSFQFGKAIGDVIFQTERWARQLEKADQAAANLESRRLGQLAAQMQSFRDSLEFESDPSSSVADRMEFLNNEIRVLETQAQAGEKALSNLLDRTDVGTPTGSGVVGFADDIVSYLETFVDSTGRVITEQERQNAQTRNTLDLRRQEIEQLEKMIGIEKDRARLREEASQASASASFLEGLGEQLTALQHQLDGTIDLTQVMKSTIAADREGAVAMLEEIERVKDLIKERDNLARQKETEAKAEETRLQRIQDLQQRELDRLTEQRILLEQGAEAAKRWRLEKEGLSAADSAAIAAEEERLRRMAEAQGAPIGGDGASLGGGGALQAFESRLLTRGSSEDPQQLIQKNTEAMVKAQQTANEKLERLAKRAERAREMSLNVQVIS